MAHSNEVPVPDLVYERQNYVSSHPNPVLSFQIFIPPYSTLISFRPTVHYFHVRHFFPPYCIFMLDISSHSTVFSYYLFHPTLLYFHIVCFIPLYCIFILFVSSHSTVFSYYLFHPTLLYFHIIGYIPLYCIFILFVSSHSTVFSYYLFHPTLLYFLFLERLSCQW